MKKITMAIRVIIAKTIGRNISITTVPGQISFYLLILT